MNATENNSPLSLQEAARLLQDTPQHEAELELAHAIEHGSLHANIKRWASEQWEGQQLPGNINRRETWIARDDFDTWLAGRTLKFPLQQG
ncbi:MAG: hypothetical protein H6943_10055 [Zoogloeaceae bacterium]|nr:hypothetical protein [Zoogloeaceae bacterium]